MNKRTFHSHDWPGTFLQVQRLRKEGKDTEAVQVLETFALHNSDQSKQARELINEIDLAHNLPPQSQLRLYQDAMGIPQGVAGNCVIAAEHC